MKASSLVFEVGPGGAATHPSAANLFAAASITPGLSPDQADFNRTGDVC